MEHTQVNLISRNRASSAEGLLRARAQSTLQRA